MRIALREVIPALNVMSLFFKCGTHPPKSANESLNPRKHRATILCSCVKPLLAIVYSCCEQTQMGWKHRACSLLKHECKCASSIGRIFWFKANASLKRILLPCTEYRAARSHSAAKARAAIFQIVGTHTRICKCALESLNV